MHLKSSRWNNFENGRNSIHFIYAKCLMLTWLLWINKNIHFFFFFSLLLSYTCAPPSVFSPLYQSIYQFYSLSLIFFLSSGPLSLSLIFFLSFALPLSLLFPPLSVYLPATGKKIWEISYQLTKSPPKLKTFPGKTWIIPRWVYPTSQKMDASPWKCYLPRHFPVKMFTTSTSPLEHVLFFNESSWKCDRPDFFTPLKLSLFSDISPLKMFLFPPSTP